MLYTGLASGSSIEMDKTFNYLATNNAFDNLINIINSRDTREEVAIRLLSQHLLLNAPNQKYITAEVFYELKKEFPDDIYEYVVTTNRDLQENDTENLIVNKSGNTINEDDYEQTVANLKELMNSDNTNFVYSLLNFDHPYYSLEAISKVKALRISSSDLVKLSYETNDPGICQQTLAIYNDVCIRKYKHLKENGSGAVVQYFQDRITESEKKLKRLESELLKFNQDNNIINYYEQSKAVAIVKEDIEVEYNDKQAQLAGSEASARKLEEKLDVQELVQEKSNQILENKKRLGELNYNIALLEATSTDSSNTKNIELLKKEVSSLKSDIKSSVDQLYSFQNSVEGVPTSSILPDWVDKVVESENLKAKLEVLDKRNKDFQKQYAKYAPAGANLKRLEREIKVAEQEYLELLHGLNVAKSKFQDTQLSSNLKAVDPPYYPLKPMPSKRAIIIVAATLMCFIMLLGSIVAMEYFDNTLRNIKIATEKLGIPAIGMMPKIFKVNGKLDFEKIQNRLLEFIVKNINHFIKTNKKDTGAKTIVVFSMREYEGKTVISTNIARKLKESENSVLILNPSQTARKAVSNGKYPFVRKIFGYQDPRSDYNQPVLQDPNDYLTSNEYKKYELDTSFFTAKTYRDLTVNESPSETSLQDHDYVIIELPGILETNYPADVMESADIVILVCRSNRVWSKADESLLENIKELTGSKLQFIINGTELKEIETVLGELPKKRSRLRERLKKMLQFQFHSKNRI
jgi:uncharacterized protein involved in exopolysaccharide biosynthesis